MGLFSSFKQTETPAPARAPEQVRRADLTAVPAGAGWHAVRVRGKTEEASLWPSFAIDFLAECGDFRPLAKQLGKYIEYHRLAEGQTGELRDWAEKMAKAGLLVSADAVVERSPAGGGSEARILSVGIPSGGDEARLHRVITSFARNGAGARAHSGFYSRDELPTATAAPVREQAAALAAREGVSVAVLGEEDKQLYARQLAERAGVDPEVALFGLCDPCGAGFACGANRNVSLLRHAGQPFLSVDDDVVCEMASAPEPRAPAGWRCSLPAMLSSAGFTRNTGLLSRIPKAVHGDYLALHEKMLGRWRGRSAARERTRGDRF